MKRLQTDAGKARLFWRYLLPHLCIILACCLCLVLLSEMLMQKMHRESWLRSLENQGSLILADAETQLSLMEDAALEISISAEFQPSLWKQNPYYEIDLTQALKKYVGVSPLSQSVLLFWDEEADALFFASSNHSGKSVFDYYARDILGAQDPDALKLQIADTPSGSLLRIDEDSLLACFHISTGSRKNAHNQATVCFPLSSASFAGRARSVSANATESLLLRFGALTLFDSPLADHEAASLALSSERFSLDVSTDYSPLEPVVQGYRLLIFALFALIAVIFSLIAAGVAYRSWLPLHRISRQLNLTGIHGNELRQIESALHQAFQSLHHAAVRSEKQAAAMRNSLLVLLLNGIDCPEIGENLWLFPDWQEDAYYRVISLCPMDDALLQLAGPMEALSDDVMTLSFCHWNCRCGANLIVRTRDPEAMDAAEMMIRDLLEMHQLQVSVGLGEVCASPHELSRSYQTAITTLDAQPAGEPDGSAFSRLDKIVLYIDAHAFDPDANLNAIAQQFNMNPSYLSSQLKQALGMNYKAYVARLRNDAARTLLADPTLTLNDICTRIGYSDRSYFIKLFKELNGMTPGEYRASLNRSAERSFEP